MMEKMAVDKKNKGGVKAIVVLKGVGVCLEKHPLPVADELIQRVLTEFIVVQPPGNGSFLFHQKSLNYPHNIFLTWCHRSDWDGEGSRVQIHL